MKLEIRLSGSGGQGIILMGVVLAESAIMMDKNAIQSQSYGPEARGGASKAEVIISDEEIYFTKVTSPKVFLALTQASYEKYINDVSDDAILIVDDRVNIFDNEMRKTYKLPIVSTAREKIGKAIVTNIVALGVLSKLIDSLDEKIIKEAMLNRVPKGSEEINIQAFEMGQSLIK